MSDTPRQRLPVDSDLALCSIMWAWNLADRPDRFVLRVHPFSVRYAEQLLGWGFWPRWRSVASIVPVGMENGENAWELECQNTIVWTSGG